MMKRTIVYMIALMLAVGVWTVPVSAQQQQQQKMVLNFHDTDIRTFIEAVGEITGKTFIIDPMVKGTVTIVSASPVPVDIVYDIALHALRLQGVSAYKTGEAITIAPETKARIGAREVFGAADRPRGPQVVTKVFPLQFAPTTQISGALKPLMGQTAALSEFGMANTLVITDYADSIERLSSIIEKLDQPKRGSLEVMKLKYIPAEDFVKLFESVYSYSTGASTEARSYAMIADKRTNSVILRTDNTVISGQIHAFASRVDVPVSESGGIRVIKLRYADPAKIAKILSGINANQDKAGGHGKTDSVIVTPPAGGTPGAPPQPVKAGDTAGVSTVQSGIFVEEDTHSLVIAAPENEFNIYKTIIEGLDIPRKQVYIEGLIAEVTSTKVAEFGIQWQSSRGLDANTVPTVMGVGGTNFGSANSTPLQIGTVTNTGGSAVLSASTGLNIGVVNGTITLPNGTILPNLLSLAHALETDSSTNIISTPTLLALDSEEAKISVGQNVPIKTGSYANTGTSSTGGTVSPFTTIERKDIGLELKIKTRIVGDDMVQLDVSSDINDLVAGSGSEPDGWRFNKRAVHSKIMVKDGKVIVIGGLMQDAYKNGSDKVPLLGDIPLIGALFRYDQKRREKTNLMVFLRPEIMASPDSAKSAVAEKYESMIQKQGEQAEYWNPVLPRLGAPQMPPLEPTHAPSTPASPTAKEAAKPATPQQPAAKPAPAQPSSGKKEETAPPKSQPAVSPGIIRAPADPQKK